MSHRATSLEAQDNASQTLFGDNHDSTPVVLSTSLPPNTIAPPSDPWSGFIHAMGFLLIIGASFVVMEGGLDVGLLKEAWHLVPVLAAAYFAAWMLDTEFERYPCVYRLEAAGVSLLLTVVPASAGLHLFSTSPTRDLALLAGAGCISCFLVVKLLRRYRPSRLMVVPGGNSHHLMNGLEGNHTLMEHTSLEATDVDGVAFDLHTPVNGQQDVLAKNSMKGVPVYHSAFIYELLTGRVMLDSSCVESVGGGQSRGMYRRMKRALELSIIALTLPVTVPLMLLTALVIRVESPGPVLFWQMRVGKNGEAFEMVKFRSMYVNNDGEHAALFAKDADDRITRVGRFIRQFRIDELPQIWNAVRGEMSLIGPRPEQLEFVETFAEEIPHYDNRHSVRPGITGWAQVRHGYASDSKQTRRKLEHDLYYLRHESFSIDLLILYLTVKTICTGFGAR